MSITAVLFMLWHLKGKSNNRTTGFDSVAYVLWGRLGRFIHANMPDAGESVWHWGEKHKYKWIMLPFINSIAVLSWVLQLANEETRCVRGGLFHCIRIASYFGPSSAAQQASPNDNGQSYLNFGVSQSLWKTKDYISVLKPQLSFNDFRGK